MDELRHGRRIRLAERQVNVALLQNGMLRNPKDASDHAGIIAHDDGFAHRIHVRRDLGGKRLAQNHLIPVVQRLHAPGEERLRKEFEDLRIHLIEGRIPGNAPPVERGGGAVHVDPASHLHIRDAVLYQGQFARPGGHPIALTGGQRIDPFMIRCFPRHGKLLPGIARDDNHKGQAHDEPHGLDDGVQLIAGEEFQITLHTTRSLTIPRDWPGRCGGS